MEATAAFLVTLRGSPARSVPFRSSSRHDSLHRIAPSPTPVHLSQTGSDTEDQAIQPGSIMWNELGQRLPVDELHCQKVNAVDLVDGVDGDDVRMIQRRYGARLALESRQAIGVASHLGRETFSATARPSLVSGARNTSPIPPLPARRGSGSDLSTCQSQPDPRLGYGETRRSSRKRDYRGRRRSTGADGARDVVVSQAATDHLGHVSFRRKPTSLQRRAVRWRLREPRL